MPGHNRPNSTYKTSTVFNEIARRLITKTDSPSVVKASKNNIVPMGVFV